MNRFNLATLVFVMLGASFSQLAQASTRTVCYELLFKDDRYDCPTSADAGVRRACQQTHYNWDDIPDGDYTNPVGAYLELWDRDENSADEYIGTWVIGGTGSRCVTFEWEDEPDLSKNEEHPDIYLKWKPMVRSTRGGPKIQAVDISDIAYGDVNWRYAEYSNCKTGVTCRFDYYHIITTDTSTERGGRAQALDSSQRALEVFGSVMDPGVIQMAWPASGSATQDRYHYTVEGMDGGGDENRALMAQSPAHEVGHVMQLQFFEQDDLRNDCSRNGGGHSLDGAEYDSCATSEGWAGYVAAASLWKPNNSASAPARFGFDYEEPTPVKSTCSANAGVELQVTKAFWDLDDRANESASSPASYMDSSNASTLFITRGWQEFDNGTDDREDFETGNDGVNMWDYYYNNYSRWPAWSDLLYTGLYHNCLGDQEMY